MLVTGGCGFIGSHFVDTVLGGSADAEVLNLDALTYAGNPRNLEAAEAASAGRYRFEKGDIADREAVRRVFGRGGFDAVVNFAAESHVDRSIESQGEFVRTNVEGVGVLLDVMRESGGGRFLQVGTDEVYGEVSEGCCDEGSVLRPSSPYAASKAGADLLALAAQRTHGADVVVVRCSNNYGPRQFPEKLVPVMVREAAAGRGLPVYGDGLQVRDWIHVEDCCAGILAALEKGKSGEIYNLGGGAERTNLEVVGEVLRLTGKGEDLVRHVEDRKGHDRRYAMDCGKAARELGWTAGRSFSEGMEETVRWYLGNEGWWELG